jgi:hypothetical protein
VGHACRCGAFFPLTFIPLTLSALSLSAAACTDETTEAVARDVCYSEMRWVGEKRGSAEMYPGRDCVSCHIENDGPPLVLGGTVYAFIIADRARYFELQSGTDCFGLEGVTVMVEDGTGQTFELTTNRAGNFFVEGTPRDFVKPFNVQLRLPDGTAGPLMNTRPMYGGCAYCHDPRNPTPPELDQEYNFDPPDADHLSGTTRIGLRGYRPNGPDTPTVEQELMQLAGIAP